ncbi:MAG: AEC family transporter [Alteromonadaceae bacterium]|nr:AEC family transporter [Alteromonadaceae bacterium]
MNIFTVISPLVLMTLLGFICAKKKWFNKTQIETIGKFTFNISIPSFLFYQMANAKFSDQISPELFAAFYLPVLCCYLLAGLVNHFFHHKYKQNNAASAVYALGASYSNTIIVGLPVLLVVIGEQVIGIVFLIVTFHSAMLFALTSAIASTVPNKNGNKMIIRTFIKQTFNNPLIISILSGLFFNIASIQIPIFLNDSLVLIGKPAITLALFILGASLAFYQVRSELSFILIASFLKLILLPIMVYFSATIIFELEPLVTTVLVVLSACPTGVNAYLIAKVQGQHQETVASSVVISTLACVITIPFWLWWLNLSS